MRIELVRIGNSRGIRIPKPLLVQCGFGDAVDLRVENDRLVIAAEKRPREGWDSAFQAAGAPDADEALLEGARSEFDRKEWRW